MVMVQNDSDSSESDSGRHDRFRSERVLAPSTEERKRSPRERVDRERERERERDRDRDRDREREREREREKERDRRRRSRERSRERSRRRREEVGERYFGPALPPPHLQHGIHPSPDDDEDSTPRYSYGPALPPSPPSPQGETVGPHLPGDTSAAATALEHRARSLRKQMENKAERERSTSRGRSRREEWMTSLPEERRGVPPGTTGARKFRTSEVPQMSSEWTMTPADKARQSESGSGDWERSENERRREAKDRKEMAEEEERRARKEKKRAKSLLEQHQKALKKKKKKEKKERNGSKREERRPFDRNIDLDCSRLDAAQRRSVINKAALLDSRFSYGEAKYL